MNEQKRKYRVTNWRDYNAALVARGCQATPETAPLTTPKIDPHKYLVIGLERPQSA